MSRNIKFKKKIKQKLNKNPELDVEQKIIELQAKKKSNAKQKIPSIWQLMQITTKRNEWSLFLWRWQSVHQTGWISSV